LTQAYMSVCSSVCSAPMYLVILGSTLYFSNRLFAFVIKLPIGFHRDHLE
jgi:hypothetical protein